MNRTPEDPVLSQFRTAVRNLYGDRLERILFYGSRARGDARDESDYDFAVFLRDLQSRWTEMKRLSSVAVDILDNTGHVVHAKPYAAGTYNARTPLMREVRRDGRDL